MKVNVFFVFVLSIVNSIFAQEKVNSGSISGKIIDKTTKEAIGYASVSVKEGDKVLTGAISKENGSFSITNLDVKSYTIQIEFIGFKTHTKSITLTPENKAISLGTIALESEATQLQGVNVVAERSSIVQKTDRKVVTVGKDLVASGTNASEILNNIPSVSIDAQTKELSLRGNSNVRVLIDGKPSNVDIAQLLQQIPSSSIKQIELITNPSAKYNPEGMSGIINIILHKNTNDGFNGNLTSGVTFGITPKTNSALNLNYKVGKVNLYSNYGFNHGRNANHGFVNSFRPGLENRQDFEFNNLNTSHLLKVGMDYFINEKNTLSFYTNQNISGGTGDGLTLVNYTAILNNDTRQLFDSKSDNYTQTYDMVFKHDFDKKGENLEVQANFSNTKNPEITNYNFTQATVLQPTLTLNDVDRDTDYLQINVDYINPLTETTKLELGAETRLQNITNAFYENIANSGTLYAKTTNSDFDFNRNINSFYTNFSKQWKKWSAQVGVRLEHFEINGIFNNVVNSSNASENLNDSNKLDDTIFSVYPSAFLTYTVNDKNSFNFNYSRRVDRPSIGQISPIREWTTPLIESRGNPNLKPQFTNSFEVNYTRNTKLGSVTTGVFYRQINDEIGRIIYKNPTNNNQDILSYDNFDNNNAYGVEISGNLKFAKWWSANVSSDAYFKTVRGTVENATTGLLESGEVDAILFNTRLNNTFTATKNLKINLFGLYRGRDLGLQFERKAMYKTDLGATYTILKGKGTITGRVNDVFNTMFFEFDGNIPYNQNGAFYWESQTFFIGFNYNFGGGKNKALQRKQRDANETQGGGGMF